MLAMSTSLSPLTSRFPLTPINAPVAIAPMPAATPPMTVAAGGPNMIADGMAAAIARVPRTALMRNHNYSSLKFNNNNNINIKIFLTSVI